MSRSGNGRSAVTITTNKRDGDSRTVTLNDRFSQLKSDRQGSNARRQADDRFDNVMNTRTGGNRNRGGGGDRGWADDRDVRGGGGGGRWGHDDRDVTSYSSGGNGGRRGGGRAVVDGSRAPGRRSSFPPSGGRDGGALSRGGGGRGGRGGRGASRGGRGGRGGGRSGDRKPMSKDALDAELDSYMLGDSETAKVKLDEDLENYMKSVGQEEEEEEEDKGAASASDESVSAVADALEEKKEEDDAAH